MPYIYLMKTDDSLYKIGVSVNPKRRLKQIQTGNSNIIDLICEYKTEQPYLIESILHNRYSHCKQHGEWYELLLSDEIEFMDLCSKIENNIKFLKEQNNIFIK